MRSDENETRPVASSPDLPRLVEACRADGALMAELGRLYDQADRAAAKTGLTCMGGGICCRFDLFDHRLFLSVAEMAFLSSQPPPQPQRALRRRCPSQVGPRCVAHSRRPLGCRLFLCRAHEKSSLTVAYERLHDQVRLLHTTHCRPYVYAELTEMMTQLYSP